MPPEPLADEFFDRWPFLLSGLDSSSSIKSLCSDRLLVFSIRLERDEGLLCSPRETGTGKGDGGVWLTFIRELLT